MNQIIRKNIKAKNKKKWIKDCFSDLFFRKRVIDGYRSRSAYKLIEINKKFNLLNSSINFILDLGAAPGGWSQVIVNTLPKAKVFAIDLLDIDFISDNCTCLKYDFIESANEILDLIGDRCVDLIVSDMAPSFTGHKLIEQEKSFNLCLAAIEFANLTLKKNGSMVIKFIMSENYKNLINIMNNYFNYVKPFYSSVSKKKSTELFIIAKSKK